MNKFLNYLRNNEIDGTIIDQIITEHKPIKEKAISQYERYKASVVGVPILRREAAKFENFETGAVRRIDDRVNNRLNNAFDAEIVDTKVGYMFGHPISYETEKDGENKNTALAEQINRFNTVNNIADADSEWGKKAAISGYGARLAYIAPDGSERIANVNPWEAVFIAENDITEPSFALRYYTVFDWVKNDSVQREKVTFYDDKKAYFFEKRESNWILLEKKPHMFDYCPLFGLPNNDEQMGDAEKVIQLIDAYDRTLSDASNEIEQLRLAYLILKGAGMDDEEIQQLKKNGVFELFGENDDVKFLTKDINDTMIENHLNRLEENILRFAKSVNFSDESFGGNVTGVAMKYKLMALENKCITMERKMTAALRYQYKLLCSAWAKKSKVKPDDYLKVWFSFKRNLPSNTLEEAEIAAELKGQVSEETRLSMLSFVDDVQYEIERMKAEQDAYDLDDEKDNNEDEN
ncbi:phage portal protein [Bacillus subtilis]|uniref:phage portal protein n=1 Tax=Bacillus subtilis TaxID=1423 RepID=UPI000EF1A791|nr:phage portal protein [Bacillus subtilis]AYK60064.1 phage portal protein [Bacillus subtilis subsp. subtilis]MDI6546712.1 phage portal protein [Bacillus subtilis]MEC1257667.1 phage portal protein [Bacillus subtilis]MEC1311623.1 phage portal protein [Bacillus subtilis]